MLVWIPREVMRLGRFGDLSLMQFTKILPSCDSDIFWRGFKTQTFKKPGTQTKQGSPRRTNKQKIRALFIKNDRRTSKKKELVEQLSKFLVGCRLKNQRLRVMT